MQNAEHLNVKIGKGQLFSEFFITCDLSKTSDNSELTEEYNRLLGFLHNNRIVPIYEKVFGRLDYYHEFIKTRSSVYKDFTNDFSDVPLTYIQGTPADPHSRYGGVHLYGIQIHQKSMVTVDNLFFSHKCIGKVIKTKDVQQSFLLSITGKPEDASPGETNGESEWNRLFRNVGEMLNQAGFQINDLVRTWIYIPRLLAVYQSLNTARTNEFQKYNFAEKDKKIAYPASTGIQGRSISDWATLDAVAVKTVGTFPVLKPMHNPLQSEAYTYGSDFSRGFVIDWPDYRILHLSGTASIDKEGNSLYIDDPKKQIEYTMDLFLKFLGNYGADSNNIAHACVFFKNVSDKKLFEEIVRDRGWFQFPCLYLQGDICRGDLVFEIDGIAVVEKNRPESSLCFPA